MVTAFFHLRMGVLENIKTAALVLTGRKEHAAKALYSQILSSGSYRGLQNQQWFFENNGGQSFYFKYQSQSAPINAYTLCPVVSNIVNAKATAFVNSELRVNTPEGNEATDAYSLKIKRLLENPNWVQTWEEFAAQVSMYLDLYAWVIIKPEWGPGMAREDTKAMWVIPNEYVEIEEGDKIWFRTNAGKTGIKPVKSVKVRFGTDEPMNIDLETCLVIKGIRANTSSNMFPESPVKSLERNINNIVSALNIKGSVLERGGPQAFVTPAPQTENTDKSIPFMPDDKKAVEAELMTYGLMSRQLKYMVTSRAMEVKRLGLTLRELDLGKAIEEDAMLIADGFQYPKDLNAIAAKGSTFENQDKAERRLYQNAIIPRADNISRKFTAWFADGKPAKAIVYLCFDHVAVLQADKKQEAESTKTMAEGIKMLWEMDLLTLNEALKLAGQKERPGMDKTRSQLANESGVPLAVSLGVGGTESLVSVLQSSLAVEAKALVLEKVFGINPADALAMAQGQQNDSNEQ